jgi:DNA modification methylase
MKVELWPIDKPVPYPKNARKISDQAIDKVASSIRAFGFRQPIVVDTEGVIVVGHARLLGAKTLGLQLVPVHCADNLTPAEIRGYRLADNRTNQETEWNTDRLCEELKDLMVQDFDLALTGFDPDEIAAYTIETTEGLTDEDETPAVPEIAITEAGDLWMLGNHRLLCGDSASIGAVERLMDGQKADLAVTDPPYNVDYEGKTKDKLRIKNDKMSDQGFVQFLRHVYAGLAVAVKDGAAVYVFHADTFGHHFRQQFINAGFHLSGVCIWKKQTIVMGRSDFHWKHEPVLYGWKNGASHAWYGDRKQSTVWEFDGPTRSDLHPTMKPVALIEYPLSLSSKSGDMVIDLFGGSGSTLIGCEKTGRSARLMELDPKYCDVIVRRWQNFTGKADQSVAKLYRLADKKRIVTLSCTATFSEFGRRYCRITRSRIEWRRNQANRQIIPRLQAPVPETETARRDSCRCDRRRRQPAAGQVLPRSRTPSRRSHRAH